MTDQQIESALARFRGFDEQRVEDVANVYLLGCLNIDVPEDINEHWAREFASGAEQESVAALVKDVQAAGEGQSLLRLTVEAMVASRPDTHKLFIQAVEGVGQKMWVLETAMVLFAAVTLIRELQTKSRERETIKRLVKTDDGVVHEETREIVYAKNSGPLAALLSKLLGAHKT